MNNRTYNKFFHLHTVSGIIISFALYIIFFAGAFALFQHDIGNWEKGEVQEASDYGKESEKVPFAALDFDRIVAKAQGKGYKLRGREIHFYPLGGKYRVYLGASKDSLAAEADKKPHYMLYDAEKDFLDEPDRNATRFFSMGGLFYDLHFFDQLGSFGFYTAGVVAFLFLFALISGIVIHWNKIVQSFYVFRPFEKLKTVWTDAHTVLGTIGIPFQFVYALTGCIFCLNIIVISPNRTFFKHKAANEHAVSTIEKKKSEGEKKDGTRLSFNNLVYSANAHWKDDKLMQVIFTNYEGDNSILEARVKLEDKHSMTEKNGKVVLDAFTGKVLSEERPDQQHYAQDISNILGRLHVAEFPNLPEFYSYFLRFAYFVLALITCFVIISGVLIWLTARDKKGLPENKKRFNEGVGNIYLAICLSMFPITAFSFLVSKLLPASQFAHREVILNSVFFGGWLVLSIIFWRIKNNGIVNKYSLLGAGILGLMIPLANGFSSGNWFWVSYYKRYYSILFIDLLWVFLALVALLVVKYAPLFGKRNTGLKV